MLLYVVVNVFNFSQAMWALGNIAGDGPELRDLLLDNGIMDPVLKILGSEERQQKNSSWTLSNLCRGKNPPTNSTLVGDNITIRACFLATDSVW